MTKAESTRLFIIERIAPVFNKKGYHGTSLADITEATGLTKGSIYGNFANKEEVAIAVYEYNTAWFSSEQKAAAALQKKCCKQAQIIRRILSHSSKKNMHAGRLPCNECCCGSR